MNSPFLSQFKTLEMLDYPAIMNSFFDEEFLSGLSFVRRKFLESILTLCEPHNTRQIRDHLFELTFSVTTADRAAVLIDNTLWEREKNDPEPRVGTRNAVIEDVIEKPRVVFTYEAPKSVFCFPLRVSGQTLGAYYAERVSAESRMDDNHCALMSGLGATAAISFKSALYVERLEDDNARYRQHLEIRTEMVGKSRALAEVREQIALVAPSSSTALIQGESGTGKELIARAIHLNSKRAGGPFVDINCAAVPEALFESELFGHEKGAFTSASAQKKGECERANGGTLFLDEIGEMPLTIQAKLLRMIQEREIKRIGGTRPIPIDVRIVAATNRNLPRMIEEGKFREDLFYRLNVVPIVAPPLRDRLDDIPLLADQFIREFATKEGKHIHGIAPDAVLILQKQEWRGNIRELKNVIDWSCIRCTGPIVTIENLPRQSLERDSRPTAYHPAVRAFCQDLVRKAHRQADGNMKRAAELLELEVTYLYRLVKNLELTDLRD